MVQLGKKNLTEHCVFCSPAPCTCNPSKKKKASAKKPPKPTKADPVPVAPVFKKVVEPERDLTYESALRAVYPILHPKEQKKIDQELNRPYGQDVDRRRAEWIERHGME